MTSSIALENTIYNFMKDKLCIFGPSVKATYNAEAVHRYYFEYFL